MKAGGDSTFRVLFFWEVVYLLKLRCLVCGTARAHSSPVLGLLVTF